MSEELREQLAAIEHQRWADWQEYMHRLAGHTSNAVGYDIVIPANLVDHWERQIATPYADLSEAEKQSDRDQVDRYWPLIAEQIASRDVAIRLIEESRTRNASGGAWAEAERLRAHNLSLRDVRDALRARVAGLEAQRDKVLTLCSMVGVVIGKSDLRYVRVDDVRAVYAVPAAQVAVQQAERKVLDAAKEWRRFMIVTATTFIHENDLIAAVDALAAVSVEASDETQLTGPDIGSSGARSNEDGGGVGVSARGQALADILGELVAERVRQDAKWGGRDHPDGTARPSAGARATEARSRLQLAAAQGNVTWQDIHEKQIAGAFAEIEPAALRAELIQVAAVAVAWIEAIDRRAVPVSGGTEVDAP